MLNVTRIADSCSTVCSKCTRASISARRLGLLARRRQSGVTWSHARRPPASLPHRLARRQRPWPNLNIQQNGSAAYAFSGFGTQLRQSRHVQDHRQRSGDEHPDNDLPAFSKSSPITTRESNGTGANVASSCVNYQTGDHQITFSVRPCAALRTWIRPYGQTSSHRTHSQSPSVRRDSISLLMERRRAGRTRLYSPRLRAGSTGTFIPARGRTSSICSTVSAQRTSVINTGARLFSNDLVVIRGSNSRL